MNRKERRAQQFAKDGFENLSARLGMSPNTNNLISQSTYTLNPITRRRVELEQLYRGSWIIAVAIDCVADDMTRAGIDFSTDVDPDDAEEIQTQFQEMQLWGKIGDTIRWARLFGGAVAVILIDGQDLESELKVETVAKDQFKGLYVMDRWQLLPTITDIIDEYGPDFGKPAKYKCVADQSMIGGGMKSPLLNKTIHHSRIIRFEGAPLPFYQRMAEFGWGMSIVERIFDRLVAFDSATQGAAQLVYKAHLRTIKVEGLKQILGAGGGPAFESLLKNIEAIRQLQSSEGLTVIDAKDEMEFSSYTFAGLPEIVMQFGQQISGAIQVPLVRLFGQSPGGLNSTGESDLRIYYDGINKDQEAMLRSPITKLVEIVYRSTLGKDLPEGFNFQFSPLWQKTDLEKAEYAKSIADSVSELVTAAVISNATALKELRRSSQITGIFTSIEDADIEEAENAPPDIGELDPMQAESLKLHPQMQPHLKEAVALGKQSEKMSQKLAPGAQPKPKPKGGNGKDSFPFGDAGFNPAEARIPRGEHGGGEWTRGTSAKGVAGLAGRLRTEGGFTYQVMGGKSPQPGSGALILSPYSDREQVIGIDELKPADLARYVVKNIDKLKKPDHYFGAWVDNGKVYLDVSIVVHDKSKAESLCKQHKQLAYFDLDKMESVYVQKAGNDSESNRGRFSAVV